MEFKVVSQPTQSLVLPGQFAAAAVNLASVNWEREAVLVVDMGEQRTGGYSVTVKAVDLVSSDEIGVHLQVTRPGPGELTMQMMTHPYAVARFPRVGLTSGPLTLFVRDQQGNELTHQVVQL